MENKTCFINLQTHFQFWKWQKSMNFQKLFSAKFTLMSLFINSNSLFGDDFLNIESKKGVKWMGTKQFVRTYYILQTYFRSCFHDTIPYRILCYALEAFSNQYRNAEAVIETVIHIFKFLIPQQRSMIEKSFEKLFQVCFDFEIVSMVSMIEVPL